MARSRSIGALIRAITRLPEDDWIDNPAVWYGTQKEHWLGWLREYHSPGAYGRRPDPSRDARYAYNHVVNPEMLSWLIEAAGVNSELVYNARRAASKQRTLSARSATLRDYVPWSLLADSLWPGRRQSPSRRTKSFVPHRRSRG
jgi:hypothetical protein